MHAQRNPRTPQLLSLRPMERSDLAALQAKKLSPTIQRLRDSHRIVASLLVQGMTQVEVARATGYTVARIHTLSQDPAMQELMAQFRKDDDALRAESRADAHEAMHEIHMRAIRHVRDHFDAADEANELVPLNRALAVAADFADRIGYTKKTVNLNMNVDFAAKLEKARARSSSVIDARAVEAA